MNDPVIPPGFNDLQVARTTLKQLLEYLASDHGKQRTIGDISALKPALDLLDKTLEHYYKATLIPM